jgi:hypothetical protein
MRRREGRAAGKVLRCCAQVVLRLEGGADPVGKEPATPPVKIDPPQGPPLSHHPQVPLTCIDPCVFRCRF